MKIGKAVKVAKYGAGQTADDWTARAKAALDAGDRTAAAFALIAASALSGEEPETALNKAAQEYIEGFKE